MVREFIAVVLSLLLIWFAGCGGDRTDDLALARQEFGVGSYSKAEIRLEGLLEKQPQNVEAQCLLAATYNRQDKTQKLRVTAGKLREIGKPAIDKLISIMRYELDMAEDMAEVLVLIGDPAVDGLVPVLGDATARIRESATSILTRIGAPAAKHLIEALGSTDALIRAGAARILGDIGDTAALEPLMERLEDGSPHVETEVAAALYKLGDRSHVDMITKGLATDDLMTRRSAAEAMQNVVEEPPVEALLEMAGDSDMQVKAAVLHALGKTDDERAIAPLIEGLKSEHDAIRAAAADGLKEAGKLAVMPLVDLISHEQDEGTLYKAVQILGDIGDSRAVKALEKVYEEDTRPLVSQEAARSLNKIE